jgi:predicted peptidase
MSRSIFILALIISVPSAAQMNVQSLFDKKVYTSGKEHLPYRLLKPANPQAQEKFPLVIFLHGAGERGHDNEVHINYITELFLNPDNRNRFPCYVVAPQCPEKLMWASHDRDENGLVMHENPTRPMALLIELISKVEKEYPIDLSRIYVTGLSMGGYGTWDLLARFPNRFAAAVPICGGGDIRTAPEIKHVPVWAFHGTLDKVVLPKQSRMMVKALRDAGGLPGYTEYPDVEHDSWVYAYRDPSLMAWMFARQLRKK